MIALAVGLGVLGIFALRRARRRCYGSGYHGYGWHGPWASCGAGYDSDYDDDGDDARGEGEGEEGGHHGHHRGRHGWHGRHGRHGGWYGHGGPPWMRGGGRRGRRGRRWMLHAALARIDATPAQERVIVGEIDKLKDRVRAARGGLTDARVDLSAALRGPVLDDAALGAVLGRVDGATNEARAAALDAIRNIHAVLDDKQRAELADLVERGGPGGGRGGPGGRGGGFRMGPYR